MNDKKYCPLKFAFSNWDSPTERNITTNETRIMDSFQCSNKCAWFSKSRNCCGVMNISENENLLNRVRSAH